MEDHINNIEEKLKEIFENVNRWLTHGEAKNGSLIALDGAFLFGVISIVSGKDFMDNSFFVKLYASCIIILLITSLVIALYSFFPKVSTLNNSDCNPNPNGKLILMFYGDIAKYTNSTKYILDLQKYYFKKIDINENEISRIEEEYAEEIIYNANITVSKNKSFKFALYPIILALLSLLGPLYFLLHIK